MTKAASELHLTQSGISQHVKSLEESLGVKLFDRFKQKLVPTGKADILFEMCSRGLYVLEKTLWQVTEKDKELGGKIRLALPIEYGSGVIVPIISKFLKTTLRLKYVYTTDWPIK